MFLRGREILADNFMSRVSSALVLIAAHIADDREIGRRTDVLGIFPDDASLLRLTTILAIERNDEWLVSRRYLSAGAMAPLLEERGHREDEAEVSELQAA